MMKKKILFINSGSKIKEFTLRKVKESGMRLILVNKSLTWEKPYIDDFIEADTYNHPKTLESIAKYAKEVEKIDGVVTFWERDVPLAAKVAEMLGLPGLPVEAANRARNKLLMRETFRKKHVPHPKFWEVNCFEDLVMGVKNIKVPSVLKPISGAASKNVVKIESHNYTYLKNLYEKLFEYTQPNHDPLFNFNPGKFILEEYMDGSEVSVEGVVDKNGVHLVTIIDKLPMNEPYFVEVGENIPSRHPKDMQDRIMEITKAGIKALGYENCGVHAEVKITKEGPKIVEIAARLGGDYICDLVENVHGIDLVTEVLNIVVGKSVTIKKKNLCYMGGRCIIPQKSGRLEKIIGLKSVMKLPNAYDVKIHFSHREEVTTPPEGFDYVGWVIGKGKNEREIDLFSELVSKKIKLIIR